MIMSMCIYCLPELTFGGSSDKTQDKVKISQCHVQCNASYRKLRILFLLCLPCHLSNKYDIDPIVVCIILMIYGLEYLPKFTYPHT